MLVVQNVKESLRLELGRNIEHAPTAEEDLR